MRFLYERGELCLRESLVFDPQFYGKSESTAFARTNRHCTSHCSLRRVLLVLLAHVVERASKASRIAGGKQVLGRGGVGFPRSAHRLRHREIGANGPIARGSVSVASALGRRGRSEKGIDLVHGFSSC